MRGLLLILGLLLGWIMFLLIEKHQAKKARDQLRHVIHVNGTRGKSAVARLIEAGLRAGGFKVYRKTTGTLPMAAGVDGRERVLHRRGPANVREQLAVLREAAREGAEVLVVECMAVDPELQALTQDQMLQADIGVITNARRDHQEQMGRSFQEVLSALSATIPRQGRLFTGQASAFPVLNTRAAQRGSMCHLSLPDPDDKGDFPENQALALAVCQALGVSESVARSGFDQVREDPYSLNEVWLGNSLLVNALAVNDLDSTLSLVARYREQHWSLPLHLLFNNREDRLERALDMVTLARVTQPVSVLLLGDNRALMLRLMKKHCPEIPARAYPCAQAALAALPALEGLVVAAGNVKGEGMKLCDLAGLTKGVTG